MATQSAENRTTKNVAIAQAAYEAYVTKDRAALEALLANNFHFTAPSTIDSTVRRTSAVAGQTAR
jgi:ketosteroid isomerase-like protein